MAFSDILTVILPPPSFAFISYSSPQLEAPFSHFLDQITNTPLFPSLLLRQPLPQPYPFSLSETFPDCNGWMWRPHVEPSSSHTPVGKTISLFSSLCIRCCFHKPFLSPDCGVFSHPVIALSRGRGGCFLLESWLFNLNPLLLIPSDCPWILHLKSLGYTARFPLSLHCLSHSAALSTHLETWNAVPAGWYESGCLAQVLGRVQCSIGGGSSKLLSDQAYSGS